MFIKTNMKYSITTSNCKLNVHIIVSISLSLLCQTLLKSSFNIIRKFPHISWIFWSKSKFSCQKYLRRLYSAYNRDKVKLLCWQYGACCRATYKTGFPRSLRAPLHCLRRLNPDQRRTSASQRPLQPWDVWI